jgi:hypothetical protein
MRKPRRAHVFPGDRDRRREHRQQVGAQPVEQSPLVANRPLIVSSNSA